MKRQPLLVGARVFSERERCAGTIEKVEARIVVTLDNGKTLITSRDEIAELIPGKLRLAEVPPFSKGAHYAVTAPFGHLESMIESYIADHSLVLEPDFQRAHVWSEEQRSRYVEYLLRGGQFGRDIYFNDPSFSDRALFGKTHMELVDGLQRLTALRRFLADDLPAFNQRLTEWHPDDQRRFTGDLSYSLRFHVNDLTTRAQVLTWYLDLNAGGTPHSDDEIARVRVLLAQENE
jgi:hypothetical protein